MKGFTLIELMVVIAISAILVGVGSVSITKVLTREKVTSAQSGLISAIRLARNYAVTSQIPTGYGSQLDYVQVSWTANGVVSAQAANLALGVGTSYFSKDVTDNEVELAPAGNLQFSVPEGKLLANPTTPADSNYLVTITLGPEGSHSAADSVTVQVDAGGKIW